MASTLCKHSKVCYRNVSRTLRAIHQSPLTLLHSSVFIYNRFFSSICSSFPEVHLLGFVRCLFCYYLVVLRTYGIVLLSFGSRTLTPGHDPVQKVTLVPRGQARGLTWFIPSDDPTLISKQQLFARIVGGLGGRAAEEVIFGEPEVTTGAAGDLQQITGLAKQVI